MIIERILSENSAADVVKSGFSDGDIHWIQLVVSGIGDGVIEDVVALCRKSGAILTFEDDLELLERFKPGGIHLTCGTSAQVAAIREKYGAEPIIGVTLAEPEQVVSFRGLDVDFVVIKRDEQERMEYYKTFTAKIKEYGVDVNIVVPISAVDADRLEELKESGVDGFILDK